MNSLFKKSALTIISILALNILIQNNLYGCRIRVGFNFPDNVSNYFYTISSTEEELGKRVDELLYWVDRYSKHRVRWNTMPLYVMRSFVELAADNLGKDSFMFRKRDFMEYFDIFNGKTLPEVLDFFKMGAGA